MSISKLTTLVTLVSFGCWLSPVQAQSSCYVEPYNVAAPSTPTFLPFNQSDADLYRYRQQQSVNLGAWFVGEAWMTPDLFTCAAGKQTAELDIAMGWNDPEDARMLLERHWDTFITENDFAKIVSLGLNTVRLPIGYWSLGAPFMDGTPFEAYSSVYTNCWSRVLRTVKLAETYKLGILIDLHGAPGSQNGEAHSGVSTGGASLFSNSANTQKTLEVLTYLTQQFANVSNVVGIELLNEPKPNAALEGFYNSTIASLRQVSPEAQNLPLYIHDAFALERFSKYVGARDDFVVLDDHSYFVFTDKDASTPASELTQNFTTGLGDRLRAASNLTRRNMIIGEWSCVLSQDSLDAESNAYDARRNFCTTQVEVYQNITSGWAFWSWTKDGCSNDANWCFQNVVGEYLPSSFSSYERGQPSDSLTSTIAALTSSQGAMSAMAGSANDNTLSSLAYAEGFETAKSFAINDLSRLGFADQYMSDKLARHVADNTVDESNGDSYREWFAKGVDDAEALVMQAIASQNASRK